MFSSQLMRLRQIGVCLFIAVGSAPAIAAEAPGDVSDAEIRSPVRFFDIKGGGHSFAAFNSAHAAIAWMHDRFAGKPAPNDCRK